MKKLTYIEDLAKELAEEHGLTYREALEICKLSVEYATKMMRDPKIISIRFPNLGILHLNKKKAKWAVAKSAAFAHLKDVINNQLSIIDELLEQHKDTVHGRTSYYTRLRIFFYKDRVKRLNASKHDVYLKIEETQNEIK
jgi:hypothetical protein